MQQRTAAAKTPELSCDPSTDLPQASILYIQRVRIINIIYINTIFNLIHSIIFNLIHSITTMSVDVSYNFHCYISFMHS